MTPEERELRRALEARSAGITPDYRARLSSVLAAGRTRRDGPPPLAIAAAAVIVSVIIGLIVVSRPGAGPGSHTPGPASGGSVSPTPHATPTASPLTSPSGKVALPTTVALSAPSREVVWAYVAGSLLFRSLDQGRTWERRPVPAGGGMVGNSISFVDAEQGWLLPPASPATQCQGEVVNRIWHTADGGASWQELSAAGIGPAQCKSDLSFVDATHGFLSAADPNSPPVIYRTADGGRTWRASTPLPDPPGFQGQPGGFELSAGPVHAFGPVLLVQAEGDGGGTRRVYVFRSVDGGATWAYAATAPRSDGTVAFVTATRWLQLVGPGQSEATTDGGDAWQPSPSDYSQAAPAPPDVDFAGGQAGYATVRGVIQRSLDGGDHWSTIATPGTA